MTEPSTEPQSPEPSPERQRQIEQAQFLVQLYEDHRAAIYKAMGVMPVEHLSRDELGDDMRLRYYYIVLGALLVQGVPVAEAGILADHGAAYTFRQLRAMPEAGHA